MYVLDTAAPNSNEEWLNLPFDVLCQEAIHKPTLHDLVAQKLESEQSWGMADMNGLLDSLKNAPFNELSSRFLNVLLTHQHFVFSFSQSSIFAFLVCKCVILYAAVDRLCRSVFQTEAWPMFQRFVKELEFHTFSSADLEFCKVLVKYWTRCDIPVTVCISDDSYLNHWLPIFISLMDCKLLHLNLESVSVWSELFEVEDADFNIFESNHAMQNLVCSLSLVDPKDEKHLSFSLGYPLMDLWWGDRRRYVFSREMFVSRERRQVLEKELHLLKNASITLKLQQTLEESVFTSARRHDAKKQLERCHDAIFQIEYHRANVLREEKKLYARARNLFHWSLKVTALVLHRALQSLFKNDSLSLPDLVIERIMYMTDHPVFLLSSTTVDISRSLLQVREILSK